MRKREELRKEYGLIQECNAGANNFVHEITESIVNFRGIEIVGQSELCSADLLVLDPLNNVIAQFGYGVPVPKEGFVRIAEGIELRQGMKLKCILTKDTEEKVGVTYILNEVLIPTFEDPNA